MELCTPRAFSNLPNHKIINSKQAHLQWRPSLIFKRPSKSRFNQGLFYRMGSAIKAKADTESYELYVPPTVEEKDDGALQNEAPIEDSTEDKETDAYAYLMYEPPKVEEKDNGAAQYEAPIEDSSKDKETDAYASLIYEPPKVEEKDNGAVQNEAPIEDSSKGEELSLIYEPPKVEEKDYVAVQTEAPIEDSDMAFESQLSKFFDKLNIKYDPEDSSSIILFGGAAVTALWMTTAIVGAIDSIPLLPKLLEVVGLGYIVWFSSRFLIFKEDRDELAAKIEDLKQEVLGSSDD
ncbi:hypothetical protein K7X08_025672 [Anisodus acutangulus]|uniref:Cyanobacterial aminoacyl-tRNA synthetase CAAD domain-containing protein n=1 Tax=Anisodus acutangulus TaxID=402998 RepID=A0A9Q1R7W1_9SOLA|nr:hypothetical protein K7X08_025672 [Anisodus acutangulus]